MACHHLCSSTSSLACDLHSLSASPKPRPIRSSAPSLKLLSFSSLSKTSIQVTHVSLKDPLTKETEKPPKLSFSQYPDGKTNTHAWVNPRSPRASCLRQLSYDSRYSSLLQVAESLDSCNPNEQDVLTVLTSLRYDVSERDAVVVLNNMSNPHTALLALNHIQRTLRKPSREVILYNVTIKVFRKSKDMNGAEKLFDEMLQRGVKPDNVTFSTLISCARVCALPGKAVEWFEKMPTYGCDPHDVTYSAMMDAYGRAANVDMAFTLYDRARTEKWRIDPVTFSTLIKIYWISGNYDGCLNVYGEMKALGAKPNVIIYNTLLDAMGRAKRPWQAKTIYKEMITNGFSPNRATYASLLRAYARAPYGEDALNVCKAQNCGRQ
ncbi:pentatricopeptide repeat-containing protein At4g16390, chloroplastic-like [Durio zibethinus]|uniref:Pentatricopeptide repeat-containing protein At4g16390, chloroplastic-like n=1 Tax=Durio zibethinus TaxID=66656 RepID=A0A6P5X804_DURZI|nr:pentatricopeptide repeat-containing protein At4g16390, chloroplastic-like [Durio zibethinus]